MIIVGTIILKRTKNLIIKNNTSYIAKDLIASAQKHRLVPRANTTSHVCDRIDGGALKGCREGGQISTVVDKSD